MKLAPFVSQNFLTRMQKNKPFFPFFSSFFQLTCSKPLPYLILLIALQVSLWVGRLLEVCIASAPFQASTYQARHTTASVNQPRTDRQ